MNIPNSILRSIFNFVLTKVFRTNKKYPVLLNIFIFFSIPIFNLLRKVLLQLYVLVSSLYKSIRNKTLQ